MKIKAFAVIDTNVLISSTISKKGFTHDVIDLVQSDNIIPIFDKRILQEYYNVFHYDKFQNIRFTFNEKDIYDTLYTVVSNGLFINEVDEIKDFFKDNKDVPFFEVKMSSEELESYLVTGNIKHFPESDTTVTPKEMISIMKYLEKFILKDRDYELDVKQIIENAVLTDKYVSGNKLLDKMFNEKEKTIKKDYFR